MKTRRWIPPVAAMLVAGVLVGGWAVQRERSCDRLSRGVSGDVQVRRGPGGQCYVCRDEGWLYDIAYPQCAASHPPYRAG